MPRPTNSRPATTSRRDFLKASAVLAATAPMLSVARGAHVAGTEQIKIGMIGCGGRCSGAVADSMRSGPFVKLVAMCDIFADRLQAKRKLFQRDFAAQMQVDDDHCFVGFDGYQKVIESADVVLIACASKFHPMYAEAAIKAGKHVFVEKPHGIDPAGCHRMQAACDLAKQKGLSIVSGLNSRWTIPFQEGMKRIHDGAIGQITAIQTVFLRGPYNTVKRDPKLTETQYQFSNWYHFSWLSGDDMAQSLVHNLDRVSWVLNEEMPASCFGLGGRSASFGEVYGDMFDHHTAVYEYPSGVRVYALGRTQLGCYPGVGDRIMGTKGTCTLSIAGSTIEGEHGEKKWRSGKPNNSSQAEQQALIDSIRSGKPINSGYHMANSTLVAVMGQLACYAGRQLTWDEVSKSKFQFGPSPEQSNFDTPPPVKADAQGIYPVPLPGITKLL